MLNLNKNGKEGGHQMTSMNVSILQNGYLIFSNGWMIQWGYGKKEKKNKIKFPKIFTMVMGVQLTRHTEVWNDDNMTDNPLNTFVMKLSNEGMEVETAYLQNEPTAFFWMSYGLYRLDVLSTAFYAFPPSSYQFQEKNGRVSFPNGLTFQWGYGSQEWNKEKDQFVSFPIPFTKVFGAQITKSNIYNNTSWGGYSEETSEDTVTNWFNLGVLASAHSPPIDTQIISLSTTDMSVDTGYQSRNKSEFFWLAYGIFSETSSESLGRNGWVEMDPKSKLMIQWGYGPEIPKDQNIPSFERLLPIHFSPSFEQVYNVQLTKYSPKNSKSLDFLCPVRREGREEDGFPVIPRVYSLSPSEMYVDTGAQVSQKSKFFWIAFGKKKE
jgi:hypothetical protein